MIAGSLERRMIEVFDHAMNEVFETYTKHAKAYCEWQKVDGENTDEQFMREIEEWADISESAKKTFREEILIRVSAASRRGKRFHYSQHHFLSEAIRCYLQQKVVRALDAKKSIQNIQKKLESALNSSQHNDIDAVYDTIRELYALVPDTQEAK